MDSIEDDLGAALGLGVNDHFETDNVLSFQIFPIQSDIHADDDLENLCSSLESHAIQFTKGYIWQKEPFSINLFSGTDNSLPPWGPRTLSANMAAIHNGVPCLWGDIHFGDNIEDEWFITWLIMDITSEFPVTARIWDNDGEFILIEAAYNLPKWLKPDVAFNRVWLHGGRVHLIPLPTELNGYSIEWRENELTVPRALSAVQSPETSRVTGSAGEPIYRAIQHRIREFPGKAKDLMYRTVAVLPARLAYLLHTIPQSIAPAIETFHYRDPYDARAAREMKHFPPVNMLKVPVHLSKCLYAQVALQEFPPVPPWSTCSGAEELAATELGFKITAGFEMLFNKVLNDNDSEYVQIARQLMANTSDADVLKFSDEVSYTAQDLTPEKDEWIRQSPDLIDAELERREKEMRQGFNADEFAFKISRFVGSTLSAFPKASPEKSRHKRTDTGGADNDKNNLPVPLTAVTLDEENFKSELQKYLGVLLGGIDNSAEKRRQDNRFHDNNGEDLTSEDENSSFYSGGDDETDERNIDERNDDRSGPRKGFYSPEKENFESPADDDVDKDQAWEAKTATDSDDDDEDSHTGNTTAFMEMYDAVLSQQLAGTSLSQTFNSSNSGRDQSADVGQDTMEQPTITSLQPVDVDTNLVESLLASYQEQKGLPGPTSSLAGLLGLKLPVPTSGDDA